MLGSTLTRVLEEAKFEVTECNRSGISITGNNESIRFDAFENSDSSRDFLFAGFDYVINCIGLIRQLIDEKKPYDVSNAQKLNTELMIWLDEFSKITAIPVIQIGTDCVFSGLRGRYLETDKLDPIDLYGETKSAGESSLEYSMLIRCSIIGREARSSNSLMSWLLSQPQNAQINGFMNHNWNGVTTLQFSEVVRGIIKTENYCKGVQHLVPKDSVSKLELLQILARIFGREDLTIRSFMSESDVNRTLETRFQERNQELWNSAGYSDLPTVYEMVVKYADFLTRTSVD